MLSIQEVYELAPLVFTLGVMLSIIGLILGLTIIVNRRLPKCRLCGKHFKQFPTVQKYYIPCETANCNNVLFYDGEQCEDEANER